MSYSVQFVYNGSTYAYPGGPTLPGLTVSFRTDDIVFHYGATRDFTVPVAHLGSFTAKIFNNGVQVATYSDTYFAWNSKWRHKINAAAIVRTPAQIVAAGLMFPFGPMAPGKTPVLSGGPYVKNSPMALGGISPLMGTTGERPDIGLITEPSAYAMQTGDFTACLAFAEGYGSVPIHLIDERTGLIWDKVTYPKATTYPNQKPATSSPYYIIGGPSQALPNGLGWDWGHDPEAAYIAYCATLDFYHLETLQAVANYGYLWSIFKQGFPTINYAATGVGQTRGVAWTRRNTAQALAATLDAEAYCTAHSIPWPDYLMPSSYFDTLDANDLTLLTTYYKDDPALDRFRFYPSCVGAPPWQQDYLGQALGFCVLTNAARWEDFYLWDLGNFMPRVDGSTDWPQAHPSVYRVKLGPSFAADQQTNPLSLDASQFDADWDTVWARIKSQAGTSQDVTHITTAEVALLNADPTNGGNFTITDTYYNFLVNARLAIAVYLDRNGYADVSGTWPTLEAAYTVINGMTVNKAAAPNYNFPCRVSINPGAAAPNTGTGGGGGQSGGNGGGSGGGQTGGGGSPPGGEAGGGGGSNPQLPDPTPLPVTTGGILTRVQRITLKLNTLLGP